LLQADYDVRSRTCGTVAAYHLAPPWVVSTQRFAKALSGWWRRLADVTGARY